MFSGAMPNFVTPSPLVEVSSVVKVFDETMKSVSAASRSWVASTRSVESTFETKRIVRSRWL